VVFRKSNGPKRTRCTRCPSLGARGGDGRWRGMGRRRGQERHCYALVSTPQAQRRESGRQALRQGGTRVQSGDPARKARKEAMGAARRHELFAIHCTGERRAGAAGRAG